MLQTALRLVMPRTRPVRVPAGVRTVTVGGATLGGSGKTRVAIAVARSLAEAGERVVLVGHAYRARLGSARFVSPSDHLDEVGDEAIVCARALDGIAKVVVAPSRQEAVDHGAPHASVLVFDGPLQLRPARASLSILTYDATDPRPHPSLAAYADVLVPVESTLAPADVRHLRDRPFGLFTAIARPGRLVDALRRAGCGPKIVVEAPDHGPAPAWGAARRILATAEVDTWVATPKCAVHLRGRPGPRPGPRPSECARLSAKLLVLTCLDPPIASALTLEAARFLAPFPDDKT